MSCPSACEAWLIHISALVLQGAQNSYRSLGMRAANWSFCPGLGLHHQKELSLMGQGSFLWDFVVSGIQGDWRFRNALSLGLKAEQRRQMQNKSRDLRLLSGIWFPLRLSEEWILFVRNFVSLKQLGLCSEWWFELWILLPPLPKRWDDVWVTMVVFRVDVRYLKQESPFPLPFT